MQYLHTGLRTLSRRTRKAIKCLQLVLCVALQGCGLPHSGPWDEEISSADGRGAVQLVEVTAEIAAATRAPQHASFPQPLIQAGVLDPASLVAGDGVEITIWESDGLGVFPSGPTGAAQLGEIVIDDGGMVYLPYVGRMPAAGRTLTALREAIMQRLSSVILSSDVAVRLTGRSGKTVAVQGDFGKPGVYPIDLATRRLSGLLSVAAPTQQVPDQLAITLVRDGVAYTVRLTDIYKDPAQDIALRAGDKIIASAVNENVVVLGAAGLQGRIALTKRNYSIIDALGDARGLNDTTAYPKGVYLLRKPVADMYGNASFLYHFDLTRPEQLANAGMFRVADSDLLYISDAPFTKVQKVMSVFGGVVTGASNATVR